MLQKTGSAGTDTRGDKSKLVIVAFVNLFYIGIKKKW